jgi:hypothetical protein
MPVHKDCIRKHILAKDNGNKEPENSHYFIEFNLPTHLPIQAALSYRNRKDTQQNGILDWRAGWDANVELY